VKYTKKLFPITLVLAILFFGSSMALAAAQSVDGWDFNGLDINIKPIASFSAEVTSGTAPLTVSFADKSTGSPVAWTWNFGDGSENSYEQNPTHTYTTIGNYNVTVAVTGKWGISDTVTKLNYITVVASKAQTVRKAPIAAFSASATSGKKPLKVSFVDKSAESAVSRIWNFGDGTTSSSWNPTHTYSKAGKFKVTLTVKKTNGRNIDETSRYITVR
jgi:tripartite motif-containing protein 71